MSNQIFQQIPAEALLEHVRNLKEQRCRLVQIGATRLPGHFEVNYSFDRNGELLNLRVQLEPEAPSLPSISSIYWCAFTYENEMHDLFKIDVHGMAVDFKGKFYQTSVKYPFGSPRVPAVKSPSTPTSAARPAAPTAAPASTSN